MLELEPRDKKIINSLGGQDNKSDYKLPDEKRSCDKTDHASRSEHWQPNHAKSSVVKQIRRGG